MKLQLPSVTLLMVDCLDVNRSIKVLDHCKGMIDFGAVRLLTHIPTQYEHRVRIRPLNTLIAYSIFMLKKVYEFIDTEHFLVVQRDGFILNPDFWNDDWLKNDYTAPLFMQMDRVGSGGFSLRSRKIMEAVSKTLPDWDWSQRQADEMQKEIPFYEDGCISLTEFAQDFKIASLEEGANFAQGGNRNPLYFRKKPFGFHRTFQQIKFDSGEVDSSDVNADLQVTYDHIIDEMA